MKRFFTVLIILSMLFALAACSAGDPPPLSEELQNLDDSSGDNDEPNENAESNDEPVETEESNPVEPQPDINIDDVAPEDSPLKDWDSVLDELQEAMEGSGQGSIHISMDEGGSFTSKEDVAAYLHTYQHLPDNFITKSEAQALGWLGGDLSEYAPGKCIGGDHFGNYEGLLPAKAGRTYAECDIDTLGADSRGEKRLVYSNDGLIYYTEDHYETFELLYGEP